VNLAKRVRDYRYAQGWGPDELAQRAEISRTALYQIESGRTAVPRAATLRRIAAALEMPVESLIADLVPAKAHGAGEEVEAPIIVRTEGADHRWNRMPTSAAEVERKVGAVLESSLAAGFLTILDIWHAMIPVQDVRQRV